MIVEFIGTVLGVILHQVTAEWSVSVVIRPHHGIHVGLQQTTPYLPTLTTYKHTLELLQTSLVCDLLSIEFLLSYLNSYLLETTYVFRHTKNQASLTTHIKRCLSWLKNKQLHQAGLLSHCIFKILLVISMQLDFVCIFNSVKKKKLWRALHLG